MRFSGYEYEEAKGTAQPGATGAGLSLLIKPVVVSMPRQRTNSLECLFLSRILESFTRCRVNDEARDGWAELIPPHRAPRSHDHHSKNECDNCSEDELISQADSGKYWVV